jgi:hypothetical protein
MVPSVHSMEQMNACEVCSFCDHGDRGFILCFLDYDTVCLVGGYQNFGMTYCLIIHARFDFVCISLLSHSATCLTHLIFLDLIILIGLWRSTNCNAVFFCVQLHTLFY